MAEGERELWGDGWLLIARYSLDDHYEHVKATTTTYDTYYPDARITDSVSSNAPVHVATDVAELARLIAPGTSRQVSSLVP